MTDTPRLEWTVHPLRDRSLATAGALLVCGAVAGLIYALFEDRVLLVLSCALLLGSLLPALLPTTYVLTSEGILRRRPGQTRRWDWATFRRWEEDRNGLLLSPSPRPSRLDPFHGLFLPARAERERIREFIRCHLAEDPAATHRREGA